MLQIINGLQQRSYIERDIPTPIDQPVHACQKQDTQYIVRPLGHADDIGTDGMPAKMFMSPCDTAKNLDGLCNRRIVR